MAKQKGDKLPLPILLLICAVLLFAIYNSLSTIALGLWGDSIMGTVDSYDSRLEDAKAGANHSRTVSKGYYFTVGGREYRGHVTYRSEEAWPRLREGETRSERIRYFPCFPRINKPSALCEFDSMGELAILYHILSPIGCTFLLLLVTGTLKRKKKPKRPARNVAAPQLNDTRSDASMFCSGCGGRLPEGAAFCSRCGGKARQDQAGVCPACAAPLSRDTAFCTHCGAAVRHEEASPPQAGAFTPQGGGHPPPASLIGFSDRCHHPEILAAARESRKSTVIFMWILVLVPLIGFPIAGLLLDDVPFGESVIIGAFLALVILTIGLISLHGANRPMWEGVVTNKSSKKKYEHRDDSSASYTQYTVIITTDTGKKKTIVEKDSRRHMYDYLAVGDRVRYHPRFGHYEKYDTSKDRILYCPLCSMMNPIQNDRCKRCNNLLFK